MQMVQDPILHLGVEISKTVPSWKKKKRQQQKSTSI